jgi:hypothetical protein
MILRPSLVALGTGLALATSVAAAPVRSPRPPAPAKPASSEPPIHYVVKPGDTLFELGRAYLRKPSDYRRVQRANQISRPRVMPIGLTLRIDQDLLKTTPIAARLSAYSGRVQVETDGRLVPARIGLAIAEGQRLVTGPGAFATLEMEDASRVTLPSNTSLRVVRLRNVVLTNAPQRVFKLDEGRGAISATPNGNPNSRFEVRTPVSVSAVRGTEFRVGSQNAADGRPHARTEVIEGAVSVGPGETPPTGAPVLAGYGVSVTASGVSAPTALLPAPTLEAASQNQSDKTVRFALRPVANAQAYRLQLSRDAGFVDLFAEATVAEPFADLGELADGTYFVRLTALDANGLEGLPADYSFDRDLDTLEPSASPTAEVDGKRRNFLFRWFSGGDGVRVYRFQLFAGTEATAAVVDMPGLSEPRLTLTDLPAGVYAWRISATRFKNGKVTEKVGPLKTLRIGT